LCLPVTPTAEPVATALRENPDQLPQALRWSLDCFINPT
jgi:hypothetical protein